MAVVIIKLKNIQRKVDVGCTFSDDPDLVDLGKLVQDLAKERDYILQTGYLIAIKILFKMFPRLARGVKMILFMFAFVLFSIYFFALFAHNQFGQTVKSFSTPGHAILAIYRTLLGDIYPTYEIDPILGSAVYIINFFFHFLIFNVFVHVLMNVNSVNDDMDILNREM